MMQHENGETQGLYSVVNYGERFTLSHEKHCRAIQYFRDSHEYHRYIFSDCFGEFLKPYTSHLKSHETHYYFLFFNAAEQCFYLDLPAILEASPFRKNIFNVNDSPHDAIFFDSGPDSIENAEANRHIRTMFSALSTVKSEVYVCSKSVPIMEEGCNSLPDFVVDIMKNDCASSNEEERAIWPFCENCVSETMKFCGNQYNKYMTYSYESIGVTSTRDASITDLMNDLPENDLGKKMKLKAKFVSGNRKRKKCEGPLPNGEPFANHRDSLMSALLNNEDQLLVDDTDSRKALVMRSKKVTENKGKSAFSLCEMSAKFNELVENGLDINMVDVEAIGYIFPNPEFKFLMRARNTVTNYSYLSYQNRDRSFQAQSPSDNKWENGGIYKAFSFAKYKSLVVAKYHALEALAEKYSQRNLMDCTSSQNALSCSSSNSDMLRNNLKLCKSRKMQANGNVLSPTSNRSIVIETEFTLQRTQDGIYEGASKTIISRQNNSGIYQNDSTPKKQEFSTNANANRCDDVNAFSEYERTLRVAIPPVRLVFQKEENDLVANETNSAEQNTKVVNINISLSKNGNTDCTTNQAPANVICYW